MAKSLKQSVKPIRVYCAGPISKPCPLANAKIGIDVADELMDRGFIPFCPHLSVLWQIAGKQKDHATWLAYDFHWVAVCDALLRIPGESKGADMEVAEAHRLGIPVFHSIDDLETYFRKEAACAA